MVVLEPIESERPLPYLGLLPWNSSTLRGHSLCSRVDTNRDGLIEHQIYSGGRFCGSSVLAPEETAALREAAAQGLTVMFETELVPGPVVFGRVVNVECLASFALIP